MALHTGPLIRGGPPALVPPSAAPVLVNNPIGLPSALASAVPGPLAIGGQHLPTGLFPATHSGAISNAQGAQLGAALGINATQWHETPPQRAAYIPAADRTIAFKTPPAGVQAAHPLAPVHVIVTGDGNNPERHFNPREAF